MCKEEDIQTPTTVAAISARRGSSLNRDPHHRMSSEDETSSSPRNPSIYVRYLQSSWLIETGASYL